MLMNVVLPAPFVPISPTTESFSIAALTSFAAVTAPKVFDNPWALRMTGISSPLLSEEPVERPDPLGQEHDQDEQRGAEAHLPGIGREIVGERMDRAVDQRADERGDHVA